MYYTGNSTVFKGISALDAPASPAGRRKGGLPRQGCGAAGILMLGVSSCHCAISSPSQNCFGKGGVEQPFKDVRTLLTTPNTEGKKVGKNKNVRK